MRAPIIVAMETAASPTPPVAEWISTRSPGASRPTSQQRMPCGEIRDAERGRLAIGQPLGDRDDEVGQRRQMRAESAGTESDDPLADLNRIDIGAAAVTIPTHSPPITGALPSSPG